MIEIKDIKYSQTYTQKLRYGNVNSASITCVCFLLVMACQKQLPELFVTGKDLKNDKVVLTDQEWRKNWH